MFVVEEVCILKADDEVEVPSSSEFSLRAIYTSRRE
jgi:hypothetical protein